MLHAALPGQHGEEVTQNNAFFYLWVVAAFVSTCYTTTWDIKMDWGLLDSSAVENKLLREEIVYGYKVGVGVVDLGGGGHLKKFISIVVNRPVPITSRIV